MGEGKFLQSLIKMNAKGKCICVGKTSLAAHHMHKALGKNPQKVKKFPILQIGESAE